MSQAPLLLEPWSIPASVAVVGAGAGGSSLAYHLNKFSPDVNITVYEQSNYIGGRSRTVEVLGETIEIGASIFVDINRNLRTAVHDFSLEFATDHGLSPRESSLGIWNTKEFVFQESGGTGVWGLAKMFWKYGLSPYRAKKHVESIIDKFLAIYEQVPFPSLQHTATELGLMSYINITGWQSYGQDGVSERFRRDVVNAATRVNYAQELVRMNGLLSAVSFVTADSRAVKGGNWQIFSHMLNASRANVHLNYEIHSIEREGSDWKVCGPVTCDVYGNVVIAHPLSLSNIKIRPSLTIRPVKYVHLYVTIIATRAQLSSAYFKTKNVPGSILTTSTGSGDLPDFQSLSVVGKVQSTDILIYKVFSESIVTNAWLEEVFEFANGWEQDISHIYRHVWDAYPVSSRDLEFDDFELGTDSGLWYLNGMERFISTMETSTIAGKNVAGLIHERLQSI